MRCRALPLLIGVALALAGCAHEQPRAVIPQTVTVTITKYVPIDDALTAPCPKAMPTKRTWGEAVEIAHDRGLSLDGCNDRMREIREISHKAATPPHQEGKHP